MKDHVRLLLIGDDGVGKSSLISTYISRHFPNNVPPIIADATIPAESTADEVPVTIMDSSSRPSERDTLRKRISLADSIIALYDVTRPETLDNVSQTWLPLIMEISGKEKKPVLVLGTKIDLLNSDEDIEKLQSIIEQFPFVVLASKCSSVKLDVDRVFHLGVSLVTNPLFPIFDMNTKDLTPAARSAFLRIFRIFDVDGDNLWSDDELFSIQSRCFITPITAREVPAIKRQIHLTTQGGIVNNRLTFEGFLALMKMSIYGAMGVVPWTILRKYGYTDDLVLQIPKEIHTLPPLQPNEIYELSPSAYNFLLSLAKNAYQENTKPIKIDSDSEVEDCLTWEALKSIWATLTSDEATPWSYPPHHVTTWPASVAAASLSNSSGLNMSSSSTSSSSPASPTHTPMPSTPTPSATPSASHVSPYPTSTNSSSNPVLTPNPASTSTLYTIPNPSHSTAATANAHTPVPSSTTPQLLLLTGLPHSGANITFEQWVAHWQALASSQPYLAQTLLFKLGFVDRADTGLTPSGGGLMKLSTPAPAPSLLAYLLSPFFYTPPTPLRPRQTIRVCILGDNGVGKSSFVWHLCELPPPGAPSLMFDVEKALAVQKSYDTIVTGACMLHLDGGVGVGSGHATPPHSPSHAHAHGGHTNITHSPAAHITNPVCMVVSAVPMDCVYSYIEQCVGTCDMVVLMFSCGDASSLRTVFALEKRIPSHIPRLFVANKVDAVETDVIHAQKTHVLTKHEGVLQDVSIHIQQHALPPLASTSTLTGQGMSEVMHTIKSVAVTPSLAVPKHFKTQPEPSLSPTLMYMMSMVGVGVGVGVFLWQYNKEVKGWMKSVMQHTRGLWNK